MLKHIMVLESMQHVEDLPVEQFISTVESLEDRIVTEKLDGANLWFGLDSVGIFSSREGKTPKSSRFYKMSDWPAVANYNPFRASHAVFLKAEKIIRDVLEVGDTVESEIIYGRQPNTVTYGVEDKNYIVILRGVGGTPQDRVDALSNALRGKTFNVTTKIVNSPDGTKLEQDDKNMSWEFVSVAPVETKNADFTKAMSLMTKLKSYLSDKNKKFKDKTNLEIINTNLTSIPKEDRDSFKEERSAVNQIIKSAYKVPIKELLLTNFVRTIKPMLQSKELHPSEDIGIEGVVVRDPVTGNMTKIVDKDVFTAINTFNNAVRSTASGLTKTLNPDAPIELRGGAFGEAKIEIAKLLGAEDLALSSGTKRFLSKFKKHDIESTAIEVADKLNLSSPLSLRTKIASILGKALENIDDILHDFKKSADEYKLQLKTGKEIGISPEVMKRTLTAFAETKRDINEIISKVKKSTSGAQLIMALYGKSLTSLFEGSTITESFSLLKTIIKEDDAGGDASGASSVGTISTANIGVPPDSRVGEVKIVDGKVIKKRKRAYKKPKKFTVEEKARLITRIAPLKEDSFQDMQFAKDVDDSIVGRQDVQFSQLKNNININGNVTNMDVNRYLDKAAEINDSVDTVTYGVETDDGKITKVHVNAEQAEDFERAMADILGSDDDIEYVINTLADTFDIIDVEWPVGHNGEAEEPEAEGEDVDFTIYDDNGNPIEELPEDEPESEDDSEDESQQPEESSEESSEDSQSDSEEQEPEDKDSDEESEESSDDDEDRDEFGQLKKKKKKPKVEESVKISLLKTIITENKDGWIFGALPNIGFQLSSDKLAIKIDDSTAMDDLLGALNNKEQVTIKSRGGKAFTFSPAGSGYEVYPRAKDKKINGDYLSAKDVERLKVFLGGE